jgi:hypothetical protein
MCGCSLMSLSCARKLHSLLQSNEFCNITVAAAAAVLQVVQFFTNSSSIDSSALPYKLNSLLPHDIRIFWMRQTAPDFNVTVSALRKVSAHAQAIYAILQQPYHAHAVFRSSFLCVTLRLIPTLLCQHCAR